MTSSVSTVALEALDLLHEGVVVVDRDGRYVTVNRSAARILRVPQQALEGTCAKDSPWQLRDASDRPVEPADDPVQYTLRTGQPLTRIPHALRHPDGATTWIETSTRVLEGPDGRPEAVLASFVDVSGRRRTEAALRYRLGFEDVIVDVSKRFIDLPPESMGDALPHALARVGRFLDADRCYVWELDETGAELNELEEWCAPGVRTHIDVRQRVTVDDAPWSWDRISRLETIDVADVDGLDGPAGREQRILRSQQVRSLLCVPMVSGQRLTGLIGVDAVAAPRAWREEERTLLRLVGEVVSNAVERRRAHERLTSMNARLRRSVAELEHANRELIRADATKDEFLSVASHELRTPLTSILGFVETLEDRWDVVDDPDRRRFVGVIGRHSRRLYRLVDDLLETSRISSGRLTASPTELDAVQVARRTFEDLGIGPDEGEVTGDAGAVLVADADHLRRILTNLLDNARKYGRAPVVCEVAADGACVLLRVRDHGDGVPEAFVPQLFEKFTQASTGTRRVASGTGLGLSIVRDLARVNGGDITYEPAHPGAAFAVRLPRVTPDPASSCPPPASSTTPRPSATG